ncbi:MAG: HD domain-containing protein [Chlorobiaceae bacterium]|nr:HD domain-containing protein [Chlorobiaceae bacterium]
METAMKSQAELSREVEELRTALQEAHAALDAIREGTVDALVVNGKSGEQIFSLVNSDQPYRILLEEMSEGALTVTSDGLILFSNKRFAQMVNSPLNKVIGCNLQTWVAPEYRKILESLLNMVTEEKHRAEFILVTEDGARLPVYLSIGNVKVGKEAAVFCLVATDLSEVKQIEKIVASKKMALAALQASQELQESLEESIKAIANTVESRDEYTAGHMRRVGQLAPAIAREMGLSEESIHGIALASTIHDLGKISIPVEILTKPVKLSKIEYQLIQTHVEAGYDIVKNIKFPWPIALLILQHHERMDGSGYPQGLKGEEILLESRIIAIADVIEAMASRRPYRTELGIDAALAEISQGRGTLYDPAAVDACIRLFLEKRFSFTLSPKSFSHA